MDLFLRGLILGFSIAAPVGPIGIICIRRSAAQGITAGFISGLRAAAADAVYGAIAAFGLVVVIDSLVAIRPFAQSGGAIFLLYLAWRIASAPLSNVQNGEKISKPTGSRLGNFLRFFFLL